MRDIIKKWRNEHGEGHWEVSNGIRTVSCDDYELTETIEELRSDQQQCKYTIFHGISQVALADAIHRGDKYVGMCKSEII